MTARYLVAVDLTDRANDKVPVWDSTANTHVYQTPGADPAGFGSRIPSIPA